MQTRGWSSRCAFSTHDGTTLSEFCFLNHNLPRPSSTHRAPSLKPLDKSQTKLKQHKKPISCHPNILQNPSLSHTLHPKTLTSQLCHPAFRMCSGAKSALHYYRLLISVLPGSRYHITTYILLYPPALSLDDHLHHAHHHHGSQSYSTIGGA